MPNPKTIRVRIAVAVDSTGRYGAAGQDHEQGELMMRDALDYLDGGQEPAPPIGHFWVEADIPVPVEETVEGKVTE